MKKSVFVFTASAITLFSIAASEAQVKDSPSKKPTSTQVDSNTTKTTQTSDKGLPNTKVVGGAQMLPSDDIVENTSKSKDHTALVTAIQSAGLTDSLKAAGPFTVFAPTNDAFAKLAPGTLDTLNKSANKAKLADVIEFHIVPGKLTSKDLALAVARANGNASLTTIEGENLHISINAEKNLQITDTKGNIALVTMFDIEQSNGIVHVVNNVLLPKE
ncbi:fasciclin domain-containing protein [Flavihumibacter sp. R14]|nr:fasciclin domain-containing protein [Flavihumibacter soli]